MDHWIADLRTSNEQFERSMSARSDVGSEAEMGAAKAARMVVQADFENFCAMLNAFALVNGESAYKRMMDRINQRVSESHVAVARRGPRKKATTPDVPTKPSGTPDTPRPSGVEE